VRARPERARLYTVTRLRARTIAAAYTPARGNSMATSAPRIHVIEYDAAAVREYDLADLREWRPPAAGTRAWLDIEGTDAAVVAALGERLELHPLIVEDLRSTEQRPRVDLHPGYIFVILRMLLPPTPEMSIASEQLSLLLSANLVVSVQQSGSGDVFDRVRTELRTGGRVRAAASDALAYALIDAVVDGYFDVLEHLDGETDSIEEEVVADPSPAAVRGLHAIRRELARLRSSVWPLRDVLARLERAESPLLGPDTRVYFRDVYDHSVQLIETVETLRDITAGLMDIYLSTVSNRLNQVMKVLTVIATIFIPLTFVTGLYGMNFHYMPELEWRYGYAMVWAIVLVVSGGMLAAFRWRRWI
jgi:magnesium transporter